MKTYSTRIYTNSIDARVSADASAFDLWFGTTEVHNFTTKRQAVRFAKAYAKANFVWVYVISNDNRKTFKNRFTTITSFAPRGVEQAQGELI
jgi:hypothetical protein